MELIAQLESARRGAYTGAFGALNHDGSVNLGMNIRCASRKAEHLEYWVGGGLVADSLPEPEVEERRWKALQILAACEW
jgi:anthranilate/para-aminobenzoate synthase component I